MTILFAVLVATLSADPDSGPGWEKLAETDGIVVFARPKAGSDVREMKALGEFEASPQAVWSVLRDYNHYTKTMPYTDESRILASEDGGKTLYFYCVHRLPLVARRDYAIKILDESAWNDGHGFLKVSWKAAPDREPPLRHDMVRMVVNTGFWRLEPRADAKRTFATYYLFTDPGGSLPKWIVNHANATAVPDVFRAIRKNLVPAK